MSRVSGVHAGYSIRNFLFATPSALFARVPPGWGRRFRGRPSLVAPPERMGGCYDSRGWERWLSGRRRRS
ncbi:MAG: hypothetical protein OXU61_13610 [Gammaproteobacteria bacterium]|nr:hypothetical protein [Gammaproteobacteria bacterium]